MEKTRKTRGINRKIKESGVCLKNHSYNLHTLIYGIFCFHSVAIARLRRSHSDEISPELRYTSCRKHFSNSFRIKIILGILCFFNKKKRVKYDF